MPEFILLMVSAPREPEYSKIIDAIESQGLEKNILIKNPVEHHELPAFYQAEDVFVLYSKAVYEQMYQEEGGDLVERQLKRLHAACRSL